MTGFACDLRAERARFATRGRNHCRDTRLAWTPAGAKGGSMEQIKIRMEAYDHESLDTSALEIVETAKRTGARVSGPVPLPTRIERYTVLRSPHIDKKSREQFEIRTHKRVIYIDEPTPKTVDSLSKLNMPAGVDIRIKV